MSEFTGSFTLPISAIAPAEPPSTYLGVATYLMPGVDVLAANSSTVGPPLAFLCAHILEVTLKAYIAKSDASNNEIRGHNLNRLWTNAVAKGLQIPAKPPPWADMLNKLHKYRYYLRYSTGVHHIGTPPPQPMVSELKALLDVVAKRVRGV